MIQISGKALRITTSQAQDHFALLYLLIPQTLVVGLKEQRLLLMCHYLETRGKATKILHHWLCLTPHTWIQLLQPLYVARYLENWSETAHVWKQETASCCDRR